MKNKKTSALLIFVLAIWGVLGFKIVGAIHSEEDVEVPLMTEQKFVQKKRKEKDTFSIVANYRDPFLGTMPKSSKIKKTFKKTVKKPQLPKRNIAYSGSVAQNGGQNRMFFVSIDGQQHIMSKNEVVNEVKLLRGNATSIKVKYPGHTETIALTQ